MKRKIICIGSGLLVAALLLIVWEYGNRDKIKINKIAGMLHEESISLKDYIESADSRYEGSVIKVNIVLKDAYEQLDVVQKFSVLDHFQKQMRYFMRNGQYATPLHSADLEIIAQSNDDMYYLTNTIPQNERFTKGEKCFLCK